MADREAHIGFPVLRLLADGRRRSGEELAAALGVSRAAVWQQIRRLSSLGLSVDARRGEGYRIDPPLDVLDASAVLAALDPATRRRLEALDVQAHVGSTNTQLLEREQPQPGTLAACLAEYQSCGRGRRGREWRAPPARGLCLSVAWAYETQPDGIEALGLAAGVIVRRVLAAQTGLVIGIKWPNDLIVDDRKLGGILVELSAEAHGPCFVVIGVGVNVSAVPALTERQLGGAALPPIDLAAAMASPPPPRNLLAAALIDALADMFDRYSASGVARYRDELEQADYLCGRDVTVESAAGSLVGRAAGIGADGRLRVACGGDVREIIAGEVSVRPRS